MVNPILPSVTEVDDFYVAFAPNPFCPEITRVLNDMYASNLTGIDDFFVANSDRSTLLPSADLRRVLIDKIVQQLIIPHADPSALSDDIFDVLDSLPINVSGYGSTPHRLNAANLLTALTESSARDSRTITFTLNVHHVSFATPKRPGLNVFTWTESDPLFPTADAGPPAPDAAPSVSSPAPAPGFTPADLSAAMTSLQATIATAVVSGINASVPKPSPPTTTAAVPSAPPPAPPAPLVFNYRNLPPDVRARYEAKLKDSLLLGSVVSQPFSSGLFYHLEGFDKIILSDGSLFIHTTPLNDKDFLKTLFSCDDDSPAGIRSWYPEFASFCVDHGFYAHPLWSFRPHHGGDRGFTADPSPSADLPDFMELKLHRMSQPIFRLLSKKDMFPKDSALFRLISASNGDGYRALKLILYSSHPVFHDQPSTMIIHYPRQGSLDLFHYAQLFRDFLQLRAFIQDTRTSLDDATEIDIFISNLRHADFINRVTRAERRDPTLAHQYVGPQLLETLTRFLMSPDSPAMRSRPDDAHPAAAQRHEPPRFVYPKKTYPRPPSRPVNVIQHDSPADCDVELPDDAPFLASLHAIQAPSTSSDQALYHQYCATVHRIHTDPGQATNSSCIVCGETHRFDACPILKNTDFLRSHYIRYCQHLKRDATARATTFRNPSSDRPVHTVAVSNQYDALSVASSHSTSSHGTVPDFPLGRV